MYSTNQVLQKELNSLAWAGYAGNMAFKVGTMGISAASQIASTVISGTSMVNSLNGILRDQSPEDIRNKNTKTLEAMGIPEMDAKALVRHRWYSPRQQLFLVESLAALKSAQGQGAFVALALTADSVEDAFFFQRTAMLLQGYNANVERIVEVRVVAGLITGLTKSGQMMVPLVRDIGVWTERGDLLAGAVDAAGKDRGVQKVHLYITGRGSTRAVEALKARGWEVHQNAWTELYPRS